MKPQRHPSDRGIEAIAFLLILIFLIYKFGYRWTTWHAN